MTKNMIALCDKAKKQGWKVTQGDNSSIRFEPPEGNRAIVWTEMGSYGEVVNLVIILQRLGFQP
jgi:hypothetical protein